MKAPIVLTRPQGPYFGSKKLGQKLEALGFEVIRLPLLQCVEVSLSDEIREAIETAALSDSKVWISLSSPTAVYIWHRVTTKHPSLLKITATAELVGQGSGTAAAVRECFGREVAFVPREFIAEEFARELASRVGGDDIVLVPQAEHGRNVVAPFLEEHNRNVLSFVTYRFERVHVSEEELAEISPDSVIVFMSPSAVRALSDRSESFLQNRRIVSIGPITSLAVREAGFCVWREAREYSEQGIIDVLSEPQG
jgi:uroporphyrinogen III methyltransferase/synthase